MTKLPRTKSTFIPGLVIDNAMEEEVKVTIVATGLADQVVETASGPRSMAINVGEYSDYDQPSSRRSVRGERLREARRKPQPVTRIWSSSTCRPFCAAKRTRSLRRRKSRKRKSNIARPFGRAIEENIGFMV